MNSVQVNSAVVCPKAFLRAPRQVRGLRPLPPLKLGGTCSLNSQRLAPVYAFLGGAMFGGGKKKTNVEGMLRKQMQEAKDTKYGGGGGKNPPSKRVKGGGGDDERERKARAEARAAMFDEAIQVTLATLGFLFLYYYIVSGEETVLLAKDFTAYKYKGKKSLRLTQALERWEEFCQNFTEMRRTTERAILYVPRLAFSFFSRLTTASAQ